MNTTVNITLVAAIAQRSTITIAYRKESGVVQIRPVRPTAITQCDNGNTIVRAICSLTTSKGAIDVWRSFSLDRIEDAIEGDMVTGYPITLAAI